MTQKVKKTYVQASLLKINDIGKLHNDGSADNGVFPVVAAALAAALVTAAGTSMKIDFLSKKDNLSPIIPIIA